MTSSPITPNCSSSSFLPSFNQHQPQQHTMAESEFSLEFDPSFSQLIEHTYVVSKQYVSELMSSDYSFPSSTLDDMKKYCRFDTGDILLIIVMTVAWTVLRWLTTEVVFKPASRYFQLHPSDTRKSPESCWKFLFYTGTVSYNSYLLFFNEDYNFFHRPGHVWEGWTPGMVVRSDVYFYYMVQGSFYAHSIFATLFMDMWRKDSIAMLLHHFITCCLIFLSYGFRYCNIGLLVFLLMDVTDVELEFTKLNVYLKTRGGKLHLLNEYISLIGFVFFTVTWYVAYQLFCN
ncbi:Ceramide synthase 1 [Chamberlinius hualienensis]